jgi:hypothetical protein
MPRFNVSAEFTLTTEIEVDLGYHAFSSEGTEEFSDESYFSTQSVEADGGRLQFVIEADDEAQAEEKATEVIGEGGEVEDGNGLTWLVEQVSYEVEEIVPPMDLPKAVELIRGYISVQEMDEELKEAFRFILDYLTQPRG